MESESHVKTLLRRETAGVTTALIRTGMSFFAILNISIKFSVTNAESRLYSWAKLNKLLGTMSRLIRESSESTGYRS